MKHLLTCFFFLFFFQGSNLYAQLPKQNVEISNSQRSNIASAYGYPIFQQNDFGYINVGSDSYYDLQEIQGIWLGAKHQDTIFLACNSWYVSDYYPGPINSVSNKPYIENYKDLDVFTWKFSREEIEYLKEAYDTGSLNEDQLSYYILSYPAKNNSWYLSNFGFLILEDMAPYYDHDQNGAYDPLKGDHPIVYSENPSFIPHEFSYVVYNDLADEHDFTDALPLGVEVQQINYLDETGSDLLDMTLFTRLIVKNKSKRSYKDVRFALLNELDYKIGWYKGCAKELNAVYHYGKNFPVFGFDTTTISFTKFLNQDIDRNINFLHEVIGNPDPGTVHPRSTAQFYNYLNGIWGDGTPLTYGGLGYNPGSQEYVDIQFPDLPTDPEGWSMITHHNEYVDYFNLPSFEIGSFYPKEEYVFDYATAIVFDQTVSEEEKLNDLQDYSNTIEQYYLNSIDDNLSSVEYDNLQDLEILVFPNPVAERLSIKSEDAILTAQVVSMNGQILKSCVNSKELDTGDLLPGMYILRTKSTSGVHISKFVKQ